MPKFTLFLAQGVRCYDTVDSRHKIRFTADLSEIVIRLTACSEVSSWVHSCYYDSLIQRLKDNLLRLLTHKVHGVDKIMLQLVFVGMYASVYSNLFLKHWHSYIHTDQAIHLNAWHERLHTLHIHLLTQHLILHNRLIYPHTLHVYISTYNYTPGI